MIQVSVHSNKHPAVAEFFELFKTEWEFYAPGHPREILLSDGSAPLDAQADLHILCGHSAFPEEEDTLIENTAESGLHLVRTLDGTELPIYNELRLFKDVDHPLMVDKTSGRIVAYYSHCAGKKIIRIGYDLFEEVAYLLEAGQPLGNAGYPTLDRHIAFLRRAILDAGLPLIEIPPCPPGHDFMVCLTHDVDFASIRNHGIDHTAIGFIYRAVIGSVQRFCKHRLTLRQVFINWWAVLSLPLVHLHLRKDIWMQLDAYRALEGQHRSTFFLIPFKNQPGKDVPTAHAERRAARYDPEDFSGEIASMRTAGWEFGLHGIDAWCDDESAQREKARISSIVQTSKLGVRMHWLCNNAHSTTIMDRAGFEYDSTSGYNEEIGFRAGTSQVFKPLHAKHLLEIPLHIQDVSLFYPSFLDLDEQTAWQRCQQLLDHQKTDGGVVTLLWHMRSMAPERLWGGFYQRLLNEYSDANAWFGTARETADWFRDRRTIQLSTHTTADGRLIINATTGNSRIQPNVKIRIHYPSSSSPKNCHSFVDIDWNKQWELNTEIQTDLFGATENLCTMN